MAYYLGIDGGGSKTTCVLGDEVSLLATITGGPSNITRVGEFRARESLHRAIRATCSEAKIDPRQIRRACIGVAGAGRDEIASVVKKVVAELIPGEIEVAGDMSIALEAAFGADPGLVVIAGTGSIAYGRNPQGKTARAGGWGYAVSDEGSAHWIGRAAVSGILRTIDLHDATEDSGFFPALKAAWKIESLAEMVRAANANPDFAALLPAIIAAADAGDALAQAVLMRAGKELAALAGIVVSRLFADVGHAATISLAMAGGVFRYSQGVHRTFCDEIRRLDLSLEICPRIVEPVVGALQIARQGRAQG